MPRPLDGQSQVNIGQHAVVGRRAGRQQLQHLVAEDGRLDAWSTCVDQRPVERVVAEPQPDRPVSRHAHVRLGL